MISGNRDDIDPSNGVNVTSTIVSHHHHHTHDHGEDGECEFCGANKPSLPYIARKRLAAVQESKSSSIQIDDFEEEKQNLSAGEMEPDDSENNLSKTYYLQRAATAIGSVLTKTP